LSTPDTATLSSRTMATITAVARTLYPHDALPDEVYARVAEKLSAAAREDPGAVRVIEEGVDSLGGGRTFTELSVDEKDEALKEIEGSDFFELVRSTSSSAPWSTCCGRRSRLVRAIGARRRSSCSPLRRGSSRSTSTSLARPT
jgi:hypothetical protein